MRVALPPHNLRGAMDYCDQCRRHLNGALTCAGCGTPAEELRQQAPPSPGPHHSRRPDRDGEGTEDHGEYEDAPDGELVLGEVVLSGRRPEPAPERRGSSSRRRKGQSRPRRTRGRPRRARGKRRRKVLIATFGVLLSLATLGLAELAMEPPGKDRASAVKEETPVDFEGGPQNTDRPEAPDDPGPAPSTDPGTTGSASPGGSGEPVASASGEAAPAASPSGSAGTAEGGSPDPSASGSPGPDGSTTPGTTGPSGPTEEPTSGSPTTQAPPPPPPPAPEPTETCILWIFCS
ncbi:hypothetical protein ACFV0C_16420 [Streptomyces sp. NPDC059568]|uniref:SCO2400 family protein n=1 Tax=Streptomyces sp. NPDC059568 TaxID=3346868 RepID=UPI0036C5382D